MGWSFAASDSARTANQLWVQRLPETVQIIDVLHAVELSAKVVEKKVGGG